jgi:hypothetical protein
MTDQELVDQTAVVENLEESNQEAERVSLLVIA